MMRKSPGMIVVLLVVVQIAFGQAKTKKMPRNINMLGYENYSPAISGDGNAMVYMSNYSSEGNSLMMYTEKKSASSWKDPVELPRTMNIPHLTYQNGYCLNFDGSEFYFTFKKSGGLGGFDLWMSKRQGGAWVNTQNLGSPINSSLNDGSPSISSDGKTMYFMSCETMTDNSASGCKLMKSSRSRATAKWGKPEELPSQINQGNTMSPNILADGETLMFLSDSQGNMQWYQSRLEEGSWSDPVGMEFLPVNGTRNISVAARGRYVYHDKAVDRGRIIAQILIPEEYKPKSVMRIIGEVKSSEGGTLKVYDINNRERIVFETLSSGDSYDIMLKEGKVYDVSFETTNPEIPATSALFDLTALKSSKKQKWDVDPRMINLGDSLELKAMKFDTLSHEVTDESIYSLRRLTRFISRNPEKYKLNIVHYLLDTLELEVEIDSVEVAAITEIEEYSSDSTMIEIASTIVELDSIDSEFNVVEIEVLPTLAEVIANTLSEELLRKKTSIEQCAVEGQTIPIKSLEGNAELAGQVIVYLKRIN
jgi:hypothetical protein